MSRARAWITGAGGLIGHQLAGLAAICAPGVEAIPLTRADLDLMDPVAVRHRFEQDRPSLILHCAGLTRSPQCETDPALARRLNVDMTARLTELASDSVLLFFSSDMVFDGRKGNYSERDEPNPLNAYGRSKVAAERVVLQNPRNIVLRTSLNYGRSLTGDRAFNEELVQAASKGGVLRLFIDEYRCPIGAEVTARAAWELACAALREDRREWPSGILHVAGSERLSRWEIGQVLAQVHPELRGRTERFSQREYKGAVRPADTSLDCSLAARWLSFPLPAFSTWLLARTPQSR
jgi:dTDP-4-dehydrorhamnose reductase